jgi:hypothetical protein
MSNTMTHSVERRPGLVALLAGAALLSVAACSEVAAVPTAQSVAGLTPSGTVRLNETFVAGVGGGSGTLRFEGRSYPFRLIGGVTGGMGLEKIQATGEVYRLKRVADFPGTYSQGTGAAGLDTSKKGDLWLQNAAGVVMHLTGTSSGVMLSLGRDEIVVQMSN